MAKSLLGWSNIQALREDAGGAKEAAALFTKQEERRRESNKIAALTTQNFLKGFLEQMETFDVKQRTKIKESKILDQKYTTSEGHEIDIFKKTKDASGWSPFQGKFRKLKDRIEFTDEFRESLKDAGERYNFLSNPENQQIISKYEDQGYYSYSDDLMFKTSGFEEIEAAGGIEAYQEQREVDPWALREARTKTETDIARRATRQLRIENEQQASDLDVFNEILDEHPISVEDYDPRSLINIPEPEAKGTFSDKDLGVSKAQNLIDTSSLPGGFNPTQPGQLIPEDILQGTYQPGEYPERFEKSLPGMEAKYGEFTAPAESTNPFDDSEIMSLVDDEGFSNAFTGAASNTWKNIFNIGY